MPTLTLTVVQGSDDASMSDAGVFEDATNPITIGGIGTANPTNGGQGLRFQNVTLTGADTIDSAYLALMKAGAQWQNVDWRLTAINEDNTPTFTSGNPAGSRAIVSGSIAAETLSVNRTADTVYNFPSTTPLKATLAAAIAAVLDRGGWASGNALAIVNNSFQDASHAANFSREQYHPYESSTAASEPQLVINYTAAPAAIDQEGYRFRNDDGSESAATWAASQDTNVTKPTGTTLRLRMLLNSPEDPGSQQYRLDYKKSTDSVYVAVDNPPVTVLSYGAEGALAYSGASATSVAPAYPTGITTKSVLLMVVGQKPTAANTDQVTTPSGWTLIASLIGAGGYGATLGNDTGNTNLYVFAKDTVAGTESGTVTVTIGNTGSTGITWAQILRIESNVDIARSYAAADTSRTTTPTSPMTLTFGADPGVTAGDYVIAAMCIPTDVTTPAQFSAQSFSQTGITFGTVVEVSEPDNSQGADIGGVIVRAPVSSGTSSAAPSLQMTLAGTLTNVRGPAIFVRVRGTAIDPPIMLAPSSNIAAGGNTATTAQLTAPSGKTTSDFTAGKISDDTNPPPAIDIGANDYTEIEWAIQVGANAVDADIYQFRVTVGGTALSSYGVTPELTVGSGTLTGSGTYSGVGTLSATPVFTTSASFAGAGTLATNNPVFRSSVTFAGTSVLASGSPVFLSSATFTATGTLTATGVFQSSAAFDGTSTMASGSPVFRVSATFAGTGVLTVSPVFISSATFAGTSALTIGSVVFASSATFAGTGVLAATGPIFLASAAFAGIGTLTADAIYSGPASAAFAGTSSLSAGTPLFLSSTAFVGGSVLTVTPVFETATHFDGIGTLAIGTVRLIASAAFAGAATMLSSAAQSSPIISNVTVTSITATSAVIEWDTDIPADSRIEWGTDLSYGNTTPTTDEYPANVLHHSVTLTGLPENTLIYYRIWSQSPALDNNSVTFVGTATLSAGTPEFLASTSFAGVGAMSATPVLVETSTASFAGSGSLTATPALIYSAAASFAGVGTLTADYQFSGPASVVFAGTSTLSATPSLLTSAGVTFAATGTLAATPTLATPASATFAGGAVVSSGAVLINTASASYAGTSVYAAVALQYLPVSTAYAGNGALIIGSFTNTQPISAAFAGSSTLLVVPSGINPASATFAGSSTLAATYQYSVIIPASATFSGAAAFTILSYGYESARPAFAVTHIQTTAYSYTHIQQTVFPATRINRTSYAVGSDRKG